MDFAEFQRYAFNRWKDAEQSVLTPHFEDELEIALKRVRPGKADAERMASLTTDPSLEQTQPAGAPLVTEAQKATMLELGGQYLQVLAIQGHARMEARNQEVGGFHAAENDPLQAAIHHNLAVRFTDLNQRGEKLLPGPLFGKVVRSSLEAVRKGFAELYQQERLGFRIPRQFAVGEAIDDSNRMNKRT